MKHSNEIDRDSLDQRLPASDPLALFHQLRRDPESATGADGGSEAAAMKAAVAELRRARELSRRSEEIAGEAPAARVPAKAAAWRLPAAAAALLAAALFYGGGVSAPKVATAVTAVTASAAIPTAAETAVADDHASRLPLVEDLDPRQAELIQIEDDGMSLVVVLAAGPI